MARNKFILNSFLLFFIYVFGYSTLVRANSAPIKIIISIPSKPISPNGEIIKKFQEELERRAPNQFKIEVFFEGGGALVQGKEIQAIMAGEIHMSFASPSELYETLKETSSRCELPNKEEYKAALEIQMMPFAFRDYTHMERALEKYLNPIIVPTIRKLGLELLGCFYHGTRVLEVTYDRPILRPEDIQDEELRVPEGEMWRKVAQCLTGSKKFRAVSHNEIKAFIQKGSTRVLEFPLPSFKALSMDACFKQIILTNHLIHYMYWTLSSAKWKQLSLEQQGIFMEAVKAAIRYNNLERAKEEQELPNHYKAMGIKILDPDKGAFQIQTGKVFTESLSSSIFERLYRTIKEIR